jgi:hypothetical protein
MSIEDIFNGNKEPESPIENEGNQEQVHDVELNGSNEQPNDDHQGDEQREGGKSVPLAAVQAERAKNKRYTEALADVERRLAESDQRWEQRISQIADMFKGGQNQAPTQEQVDPMDEFFSNPDEFFQKRQQPVIQQYQQDMMVFARDLANIQHTPAKVVEATKAYDDACARGAIDVSEAQKIRGAHNPFSAAVAWYEKNKLTQEIGANPEEYKQRLRAEIEAEMAEKYGQQSQGTQQNRLNTKNFPSNFASARNAGTRNPPAWNGAPSIEQIFNS